MEQKKVTTTVLKYQPLGYNDRKLIEKRNLQIRPT